MRLIDADALAYIVASNGDADFINKVTRLMIDAPSIDLVFCGECKHTYGNPPIADGRLWCKRHGSFMYYCSDGEREGE